MTSSFAVTIAALFKEAAAAYSEYAHQHLELLTAECPLTHTSQTAGIEQLNQQIRVVATS